MSHTTIKPVSMNLAGRDFDAFTKAFGDSFASTGFAVVADHGLDQRRIDAALGAMRAFFALPEATKLAYFDAGLRGQRGYTPFRVETAKGAAEADLKEFWHVGRDLPRDHPLSASMLPNLWPVEIAAFRAEVSWLYAALDHLGATLLRALARYLGLSDTWFDGTVDVGNSVLRLLHYPPVAAGSSGIRAGAHEDINVITLLLGADEAGLEVLGRGGNWIAINPPPGSLVCNIGDMLQRLTNHVLPSTTHRVVNPTPDRASVARYSTPFFLHFNSDFLIETLPSCISAERPNAYPEPITADDYLQIRLKEIGLVKA